jgi:large subunit ribosomal protein L6
VTVKVEGDKVLINNFLGERVPRVAKILGKTQVKIDQQDVIITGSSLDDVSQTAANIEQTTRIVGFDKKVFQDGIYITSKNDA